MDAGPALTLLLGAPLVGAVLLATPPVARAGTPLRDAITLSALGAMLAGLAGLLAGRQVVGLAAVYAIGLGPLDPSGPLAGIFWSLAPALLACVFLVLAWRVANRLLLGLAVALLAMEIGAAGVELIWPAAPAGASVSALLLDPLAATLLIVSVVVGGLIVVYALGYEPVHLVHVELPARRSAAFLAWLLLFLSAMNLLVLADDLRLLAVAWEATTLCSVVLIAFDGDRAARRASELTLAYGLLGAIALTAAVLLTGPGARLSELVAGQVAAPAWLPFILAACAVAAATKSALVPFQPWLLAAMVAAAPVSALLHASTMVKAGSYLLLRLAPAFAADQAVGATVALLGGLTFAGAALLALGQRDLKRVLALSTISSLGLIATAAGLGSPAALAAGTMLLVFHACAKALAFLSVGALEQARGTRDLEALVGSLRTAPVLASPLVVAALGLALPPFGLVVAKWALIELGAGDAWLVPLLAVGGAANVALWTAVVGRLLVRPGLTAATARVRSIALSERAPIAALEVATLAGLVLAGPIARWLADPAAVAAFGVNPGLADGWSIALASGAFAVPAVALLTLTATLTALVVARRVRRLAVAPYLSGAGVGVGRAATFRGIRGQPVAAHSGGFYWRTGERPGGPERAILFAGWLVVALVAIAAAVSAVSGGWSP